MKKFYLSVTLIGAIALNTLSIHGMKSDFSLTQWCSNQWQQVENYFSKPCLIFTLPDDALINIFSHCHSKILTYKSTVGFIVPKVLNIPYRSDESSFISFVHTIKNFLRLKHLVCKKFDTLLSYEMIGNFCRNYAQQDKDRFLYTLGLTLHRSNCQSQRLQAFLALYAGANANQKDYNGRNLLAHAVMTHDQELTALLLSCKADTKVTICTNYREVPLFFYIKDLKLAQEFIDNGLNVHTCKKISDKDYNVLWHILYKTESLQDEEFPSELLALYLKHKVDAKKVDSSKNCLLHEIIRRYGFYEIKNIDTFLTKATMLLDAIPEKINAINSSKETPLDLAYFYLKYSKTPEAYEKFIILLKDRGALTTKEKSMILLLHNGVGDLSVLPHDVTKYIVSYLIAIK
jgi:hypothetical protein